MAKKKKKEWRFENTSRTLIEKIEGKYGERTLGLTESIDINRMTTGSLTVDLIIGGGIPPGGWLEIYGPESSGKSTFTYLVVKSAMDLGVKIIMFFDYETSMKGQYFSNIVGMPLKKVLGEKDEDGEWITKPIVRRYTPKTGEFFFKILARILKKMPDIVLMKNKRYLVFSEKLSKDLGLPKELISYSEKGSNYILDKGPAIKLIAFVDSYPSMVPAAFFENPDKDPIAMQARMFSTHIPLLRTALEPKGAIIIGINHVRMKPMVMFGSPEYTPCGEHLKLATDIKIRIGTVSIPHGKGRIELEKSHKGETERLQYSKIRIKKNKTFPKDKEAILRICLEVEGKSGYGIDPVWDTFEYLRLTNQIKKRGDKITIDKSLPGPWCDLKLTWEDLKLLVHKPLDMSLLRKIIHHPLNIENEDFMKILKIKNKKTKIKELKKLLDIRARCKEQIRSGEAFELAV